MVAGDLVPGMPPHARYTAGNIGDMGTADWAVPATATAPTAAAGLLTFEYGAGLWGGNCCVIGGCKSGGTNACNLAGSAKLLAYAYGHGDVLAAGKMAANIASSILSWKIKGPFAIGNHLTTQRGKGGLDATQKLC